MDLLRIIALWDNSCAKKAIQVKLWAMTSDSSASQAMNGLYRIPRYEAKTIIRCPQTIQSFCGAAAKALDGNWHLSALTYSEWGNDSSRAFMWSWRLPYRRKCEIASLNAQQAYALHTKV